jgi:hypothetical protein
LLNVTVQIANKMEKKKKGNLIDRFWETSNLPSRESGAWR